jgi:stearoyl-CoA desaturase (delta-9 desaturase)
VWDRVLFNKGTLGGVVGIATAMLILGPGWGLLLAVSRFVLYVFVLAASINGLGHWWGRGNFGNSSATNLCVLAWLTGGESLHNNHHAYPSSPKFSMGRFEFDPSWVVIRVLMLLRLARVVGDRVKPAA